jgi:hypothetical protein
MKLLSITLGIVCLASAARAAEERLEPRSPEAIHFRLEIGVKPGHVVAGWLDTRGEAGEGFDSAVLDLDGDGRAETVQTFPEMRDYRTETMMPHPQVVVEHEGGRWQLDLRYSRFRPAGETAREATIRWVLTKGDFYAWFINGRATFHTTAEAASAAEPIRMGPPFRFQTGTRTRGRQALVTVGLKDVNGGTLRMAKIGRGELRPHVEIIDDGETRYEAWARYG